MKKVRALQRLMGDYGLVYKGVVLLLPDREAQRLIGQGVVEEVAAEKKVVEVKKEKKKSK